MHNNEALKNQLCEKAVAYWRMEELVALIVSVLIFGGLSGLALYRDWPSWLVYGFITLLVLCIVGAVFGLCTIRKKYEYWSYAYDAHFFYIQEGVFTKRFLIIPFEKIQAVTLTEGILLNQFGLATIELQGIKKVYRVPALDKQVALTIQQELAELTRQKGDATDETITATHSI